MHVNLEPLVLSDRQPLNYHMDFDRVVLVNAQGQVFQTDEYAPELDGEEIISTEDWTLLSGFTGQYYYNGPVMHESEYIGGRLEQHILSTPGLYAAVLIYPSWEEQEAVTDEDEEFRNAEPYGWAVAYRPLPE